MISFKGEYSDFVLPFKNETSVFDTFTDLRSLILY